MSTTFHLATHAISTTDGVTAESAAGHSWTHSRAVLHFRLDMAALLRHVGDAPRYVLKLCECSYASALWQAAPADGQQLICLGGDLAFDNTSRDEARVGVVIVPDEVATVHTFQGESRGLAFFPKPPGRFATLTITLRRALDGGIVQATGGAYVPASTFTFSIYPAA